MGSRGAQIMGFMGTQAKRTMEQVAIFVMNEDNAGTRPHNMRPFEIGWVLEALIKYLKP
jgi:hypothetical protein